MPKKKSKPLTSGQKLFFVRLFPLIFIVAGIAGLYLSARAISKARASLEWPMANGKILSSEVDKSTVRRKKKRRTYYHAEIKYEYSVDDQIFEGNRVRFSGTRSREMSRVRDIVNRYPKGKEVTVYYEPGKPTECVLENGVDANLYAAAGGSLFFLVAGGAMAVYFPIAAKKQEQNNAELET